MATPVIENSRGSVPVGNERPLMGACRNVHELDAGGNYKRCVAVEAEIGIRAEPDNSGEKWNNARG